MAAVLTSVRARFSLQILVRRFFGISCLCAVAGGLGPALVLGLCRLLSLASSRSPSGQYSLGPLLNSRARWFLPFIVAPSATFMPLPVLPVVLLSLPCLVLHGSEGSARARTLGVHLCSTYGCSVGLWLVGWCVVLLMRYLGIVWGPGYPREGCIPHRAAQLPGVVQLTSVPHVRKFPLSKV